MSARETLIQLLESSPPHELSERRHRFFIQFGKLMADVAALRLALQEHHPPPEPSTIWSYARLISDDIATLAELYEIKYEKVTVKE